MNASEAHTTKAQDVVPHASVLSWPLFYLQIHGFWFKTVKVVTTKSGVCFFFFWFETRSYQGHPTMWLTLADF